MSARVFSAICGQMAVNSWRMFVLNVYVCGGAWHLCLMAHCSFDFETKCFSLVFFIIEFGRWPPAAGRAVGGGKHNGWYICHAYWILLHVYSVMPCFHACDARFRIKKLIFWEIYFCFVLKKKNWPAVACDITLWCHIQSCIHSCMQEFIYLYTVHDVKPYWF